MKFRSEAVDRLFQTFLNLETLEECYLVSLPKNK